MDDVSPEAVAQLKATLEDTQDSLAIAFARIENYRCRQRTLVQELAQLRAQLNGDPTSADGAVTEAEPVPEKSAASNRDQLYLPELEGQQATYLHVNGRKIPGSVLLTKDYIDFLELVARVRREDFVGITSAKVEGPANAHDDQNVSHATISTKDSGWKQLFGGCMGGAAATVDDEDPLTASDFPSKVEPIFQTERESWPGDDSTKIWQILWRSASLEPQRLGFEGTLDTRQLLHKHTEKWLLKGQEDADDDGALNSDVEIVPPTHLTRGEFVPRLSEPSSVINDTQLAAVGTVLPARYHHKDWYLVYSTYRHGISLQTLLRKGSGISPTILIIKDSGGYVFGCFTPEPWKIAPRFYGTGETTVFQLEPHKVMYPWKVKSKVKNDYFMYSTSDCIGVGGCGHFAIWLDNELLQGNSGSCETFGSPCLASKEEFKILGVELWQPA